jgi:hypothetical protein
MSALTEIIYDALITCPVCGFAQNERIPEHL